MGRASFKKNIIWYMLRTVGNLVLGLITFPYISRVLGPSNLGKVGFAESIIAYFILFNDFGINKYGQREIAYCGDEIEERTKTVLELFKILVISTIITLGVYLLIINNLRVFSNDKTLYYIFLFQLLFNLLNCEWFYLGIENQGYITKRNIFFRILSIFMILVFVKNSNDYYKYSIILTVTLIVSNFLNFFNIFKYIKISKKMMFNLEVKRHLKGLLTFFITGLSLSIFSYLDKIMIMLIRNETELGYYTVAMKIGKIPLSIVFGISTVLFPKLCKFIRSNNIDEYRENLKMGFDFLMILSIPCTCLMFILSPEIVKIFSGDAYEKAIPTMKVISFLFPIMSGAVFTGSLLLVANNKEDKNLIAVFFAALFNVIFNFIFINLYGLIGAALGTLASEALGIIIRLFYGKSLLKKISIVDKNLLKIILANIPLVILTLIIRNNFTNIFIMIILSGILGGLIYLISLFLIKEERTLIFLKRR